MDVTEATFQTDVVDRSQEVAVVVDFWAAWCGPCRQLGPLIESAVARRDPDVVLAKVDIDANPGLAQAFKVLSIPAVKAFRGGAVVDEFVGLVSPAQMDAFLDRLVPSQADRLVEQGDEESLRDAVRREPGHVPARIALGRLLIDEGSADEAREVLSPVNHDPVAAGLLARVRLMGVDDPNVQAGLDALTRGDWEHAFTHLIDAVTATRDRTRRDDLRVLLIGQFRALGDHHPLVSTFRRQLAQALY